MPTKNLTPLKDKLNVSEIESILKIMEIIKVKLKPSCGVDRYYALNNSSELVLKLMKQKSFTHEQLKILKILGFKIEIDRTVQIEETVMTEEMKDEGEK